jgi:hypothetical protein
MSQVATSVQYEVVKDALTAGEYRVEAIDPENDGEVYVAIFSGPNSKARAEEYARWKNSN